MEVIGLIGSVTNIIDVTARCLRVLRNLQLRWQIADFMVDSLVSQLVTLNIALNQIHEWMSTASDASHQHHSLVIDLSSTLTCCRNLVIFVDGHLAQFEWNDEANDLTFQSRARAVKNDSTMKQCVGYLNDQSTALNLLFSVLNK